ncbi:hypothetical protein [Leclercia sp.]|uniref:hypothetical protein n=1 Tax=Leclercia sp. TaxID=1898428 RepID=UPI0028B0F6A8|nr:hypothetical protein [Leclercia sp.]
MTQLDLQQRIAQLEKEVEALEVLRRQKDARIAELEQQVNALAAEVNQLKWDSVFIPKNLDQALTVMGVSLPVSKEEFNFGINRWIQRLVDRVIRSEPDFSDLKRQWMAEGVEVSIAQAFRDGIPVNRMQFVAKMTAFAAQLRQPEEKSHD